MKKILIAVAVFALMQTAIAADIAWRDVGEQQTPIGAGSSGTYVFSAFDSRGRKDVVAAGAYGTDSAPFISRFVAVWLSDEMSLDLRRPGFLLFLK